MKAMGRSPETEKLVPDSNSKKSLERAYRYRKESVGYPAQGVVEGDATTTNKLPLLGI
jgi:hypothetical protein